MSVRAGAKVSSPRSSGAVWDDFSKAPGRGENSTGHIKRANKVVKMDPSEWNLISVPL